MSDPTDHNSPRKALSTHDLSTGAPKVPVSSDSLGTASARKALSAREGGQGGPAGLSVEGVVVHFAPDAVPRRRRARGGSASPAAGGRRPGPSRVAASAAGVTSPATLQSQPVSGPTGSAGHLTIGPVSFLVGVGEVVGLLGPSGSGKSTILRVIAGLQRPSAGRVCWDGQDLAAVPVHRRGIGLVFQDGQLFLHKTVAGNIEYGLRTQKMPALQRQERVAQLLELVGLAGFGDRPVTTLSGGERQRVALARSLAPRPRALLLDEPLSALDRDLRDRLAADLRTILTSTHTTAVYVTHDAEEAAAVCDRTIHLPR